MTVDFADWVRAGDTYHQEVWPPSVVLAFFLVAVIGFYTFTWGVAFNVGAPLLQRVFAFTGVMLLFVGCAGTIVAVIADKRPTPAAAPVSFTMAAEQRFGITDLACADKAGGTLHECSFDGLDSPRYAEWIRDGKAYRGRIVTHGTRVTLAPDVGSGE